jgi:predicted transposase YbfD/YdcC
MSLVEHFAALEDPRIERKKLHGLLDIMVLSVCAIISGAEGWQGIVDFGHEKLDWLRRFVPLKNGVPSHDCIAYVFARISPEGFRSCFMEWVEGVREKTEGEVIAIDGKTSRGSKDRKRGQSPLHMVSAWACANRLVLGQEATAEKSNEITAIPKLLELLDVKGCIITIDAMGCQTAIAKQIIDQRGDYVLGLKDNQPLLHESVEDYFTLARSNNFKHVRHDYIEEIDKEHGRLEVRRYWICEDLNTLPNPERWAGLRSIGMVERECLGAGKSSVEQRYFINSIAADAKLFAHAVRSHWGIENRLHWRLDVVMREDDSRIRKDNSPTVLAMVRHLSLNLFEKVSSKLSLKQKQFKAALSDDFREKVVFGLKF